MLRESDRIPYGAALEVLANIQQALTKNAAWNSAMTPDAESYNEESYNEALSEQEISNLGGRDR